MNLQIRPSLPEDAEAVFAIQHDPQVVPFQYRRRPYYTLDYCRELLSGTRQERLGASRYATILLDAAVIGYVSQFHFRYRGQKLCQCGWSLKPACWGRGIMPRALSQLFQGLFFEENIDYIFADCFRSNLRGLRLIKKLGFTKIPIPVRERAAMAWTARCLHWIKRFQLDRHVWSERPPNRAR